MVKACRSRRRQSGADESGAAQTPEYRARPHHCHHPHRHHRHHHHRLHRHHHRYHHLLRERRKDDCGCQEDCGSALLPPTTARERGVGTGAVPERRGRRKGGGRRICPPSRDDRSTDLWPGLPRGYGVRPTGRRTTYPIAVPRGPACCLGGAQVHHSRQGKPDLLSSKQRHSLPQDYCARGKRRKVRRVPRRQAGVQLDARHDSSCSATTSRTRLAARWATTASCAATASSRGPACATATADGG
ncbi:unnamed protein product [Ectocarpus sp. 4 AP-2014]